MLGRRFQITENVQYEEHTQKKQQKEKSKVTAVAGRVQLTTGDGVQGTREGMTQQSSADTQGFPTYLNNCRAKADNVQESLESSRGSVPSSQFYITHYL